jgi:hypothetical protein
MAESVQIFFCTATLLFSRRSETFWEEHASSIFIKILKIEPECRFETLVSPSRQHGIIL